MLGIISNSNTNSGRHLSRVYPGSVAVLALAATAGIGLSFSQKPTFEVASVKRNISSPPPLLGQSAVGRGGVRLINYSLLALLIKAFNVKGYQIIRPSWLDTEHYDVIAKAPEGATPGQFPVMLQNLLVDRFQMKFHLESRELPAYVILVDKGGPKLKPFRGGSDPLAASRVRFSSSGHLEAKSIENLASMLSISMDRPVLDMTGIHGTFDIKLDISRDQLPGLTRRLPRPSPVAGGPSWSDGPSPEAPPSNSLSSALKTLGLKIKSRKEPIDCIVIDKVEKDPTPN